MSGFDMSEEEVEIMDTSKSALQPMLDSRDRSIPFEYLGRTGGWRLSALGVKGRKQLPFSDVLECFVFLRYLWVERDVMGGGWLLRAYNRELKDLYDEDKEDFAEEFLKLVFSEDAEKKAYFVNGVIKNEANELPDDLIEFQCQLTPNWFVKVGSESEMDIPENITEQSLKAFKDKVCKSYSSGKYHDGPMREISLVADGGQQAEEGRDLLEMLEANPILRKVLPWGSLAAGPSNLESKKAAEVEQYGPWMFTRPGEYFFEQKFDASEDRESMQMDLFMTEDVDLKEQILFKDRVYPHYKSILTGDLVKENVAVVGVVKAVHCGNHVGGTRKTKQLVAFHARDFDKVAAELNVRMDLGIPTVTQALDWMKDWQLDKLRSQGVRYSKFDLLDGDIYFIPRNVIHQAKSVSAATYITWNLRLKQHLLE